MGAELRAGARAEADPFDIEQARMAMFNHTGKTPEFDLLSKSLSNLLRMWSDA